MNAQSTGKLGLVNSNAVKQIRSALGLTQSAVARALGISIRAVQSYEQGWRETPTSVTVQLLVLAAAYRSSALDGKPCWEVTGCPAVKQMQCPCRHTDGHLCWLVSGRMCGVPSGSEEGSLQPCLDCLVVRRLLSSPDNLKPNPLQP
jgi:DNA-binding XRE family transcriptional regulator